MLYTVTRKYVTGGAHCAPPPVEIGLNKLGFPILVFCETNWKTVFKSGLHFHMQFYRPFNIQNWTHEIHIIIMISIDPILYWELLHFLFLRMIGQGVASLSPGLTFLRFLSKLSKPIMTGQYCPLLQNCTTSTHYLLINCFLKKCELSFPPAKCSNKEDNKQ